MKGFERYEAERQRLIRMCDQVVLLSERASGTSDFERLVAAKPPATGDSPVEQLIKEAKNRLKSSMVEVGIFGSIKRGKSTLINALVGADISPMRVTPETAIPVWIESGYSSTAVLLADGTLLTDVDPEQAREMCTQRYKPRDAGKKPIRVLQQRPIDWLPQGVRIVDTPGLDDPSLAEDYERLTLAELDRVAAAVVVLVSPPGPAGDEIRLLRSLGERGIDKLFLVCNFYPDHWADPGIRNEMVSYIASVVRAGAGAGLDSSDVKVFPVQARSAFRAAVGADADGLEAAGVAALRRELAEYLTKGVLDRMVGFVDRRLEMSRQIIADQLMQRRRILSQPEMAGPIRMELQGEIDGSRLVMDGIKAELGKTGKEVASELASILSAPFEAAMNSLSGISHVDEVESLGRRLRMQFETATSEASTTMARETEIAYARVHRQLYDSLGVSDRVAAGQSNLGGVLRSIEVNPGVAAARADWSEVTMAGLVGGAGVGAIAGTIAGGVGTALIVAGPVGWLIGLGLGALFGGGLSAAAARRLQHGRVDQDGRRELNEQLMKKMLEVRSKSQRAVSEWVSTSSDALDHLRSNFYRAREEELARVDKIVGDAAARSKELHRVDELLDELKRSTS